MPNTFTRMDDMGIANVAFDRTSQNLGTPGAEGIANYNGVQNARTLSGAIMQPTGAEQAKVMFNQVMMKYSENFEPFIQQSLIDQPSFWYERVMRGTYNLFSGATKETRVFRGGLVHYAGLGHWGDVIDYSVNAGGMNGQAYPKTMPDPVTYGYSWDRLQWSGKNMSWASDPINQDMFRFTNDAQLQLSWILQAGVDFGRSQQEVWNRDNMIFAAIQSGRGYIMTVGGESAAPSEQFYYNPYAYGTGPNHLSTVPFIVFPADVDVMPLNFDVLDYANDALAVRARSGGIAMENNRPIFGLPIAMRDFEKYVFGDTTVLENWRHAAPSELISGFGMQLRPYRYFAPIEDTNQLRFKIKKVITAAQATDGGITVFGNDATKALFLAEYVPPRVLGRAGTNGIGIPQENMDYIKAELAVAPLFMNNVFVNQFVPATPNLGSGTSFGAQTGLNGMWGFQNIIDRTTNPFGKVGNFYGTLEIFPKPEEHFINMTAFLYRRCTETLQSRCPVNIDVSTASTAAVVSTGVTSEATGEVILNTVIEVTLNKALDVTIGTPVSVGCLSGGNTASTVLGLITGTSGAAHYSIAITDLNSTAGTGSTGTTYFKSVDFPAGKIVTVL